MTYYECRMVTKSGDGARTVTKADDDTAQPTFVTMRSGSSISRLKSNLIASSNRCMGRGSSGVVDEKPDMKDEKERRK